MRCSRFGVIACQLAIKGMYKNMSLLKTELPGLLPSVVCTPALIACVAMESASSTISFAVVIFCGGSSCNNVLRMLPTVCCLVHSFTYSVRLRILCASTHIFDVAVLQ